MAHGASLPHTYPLEQGYLKDNFGDSTPEVLPLIDLFDPSRLTVSQQSESADGNPLIQRVSYKKRVYEQCEFFIIQNEKIFRVVPKRSFDTKMAGNSSPYTSWIEDWCMTDWQGQIRTTCHFL